MNSINILDATVVRLTLDEHVNGSYLFLCIQLNIENYEDYKFEINVRTALARELLSSLGLVAFDIFTTDFELSVRNRKIGVIYDRDNKMIIGIKGELNEINDN